MSDQRVGRDGRAAERGGAARGDERGGWKTGGAGREPSRSSRGCRGGPSPSSRCSGGAGQEGLRREAAAQEAVPRPRPAGGCLPLAQRTACGASSSAARRCPSRPRSPRTRSPPPSPPTRSRPPPPRRRCPARASSAASSSSQRRAPSSPSPPPAPASFPPPTGPRPPPPPPSSGPPCQPGRGRGRRGAAESRRERKLSRPRGSQLRENPSRRGAPCGNSTAQA